MSSDAAVLDPQAALVTNAPLVLIGLGIMALAVDRHQTERASGVVSARRLTAEPIGVGATLEGTSKVAGRRLVWQYTVMDLPPANELLASDFGRLKVRLEDARAG